MSQTRLRCPLSDFNHPKPLRRRCCSLGAKGPPVCWRAALRSRSVEELEDQALAVVHCREERCKAAQVKHSRCMKVTKRTSLQSLLQPAIPATHQECFQPALFTLSHTLRMLPTHTRDSTAISLTRMFREGPEVSFRGSPTVSPITAALWQSLPLPPSSRAWAVLPACRHEDHAAVVSHTQES